jgi:hypothetical protein
MQDVPRAEQVQYYKYVLLSNHKHNKYINIMEFLCDPRKLQLEFSHSLQGSVKSELQVWQDKHTTHAARVIHKTRYNTGNLKSKPSLRDKTYYML